MKLAGLESRVVSEPTPMSCVRIFLSEERSNTDTSAGSEVVPKSRPRAWWEQILDEAISVALQHLWVKQERRWATILFCLPVIHLCPLNLCRCFSLALFCQGSGSILPDLHMLVRGTQYTARLTPTLWHSAVHKLPPDPQATLPYLTQQSVVFKKYELQYLCSQPR